MQKTCAAEKNRTTDTMWIEKKEEKNRGGGGGGGGGGEKGGSTQNIKEPYDVLKRTWLRRDG